MSAARDLTSGRQSTISRLIRQRFDDCAAKIRRRRDPVVSLTDSTSSDGRGERFLCAAKSRLDVQRRRRADHRELAAAHSEQPVVDGRRCLEFENVAGLGQGRVELERHDLARRVEVALDMQLPVAFSTTRVDVKRTCGCSSTPKKSFDRRCLSRVRFPVSRLAASIVSSIFVPQGPTS
jgi:hypothetical protein